MYLNIGYKKINLIKIESEPKRDWSMFFISGHRLRVILYMIMIILSLYAMQFYLWPDTQKASNFGELIWSFGSILWLGAFLPGTMGLIGLLSFNHPRNLDKVRYLNKVVSFRIVSKGTNVESLKSTILRCRREMKKTPLFPYVIEVVVDFFSENLPKEGNDLVYIVVPEKYQTKNKSLYKARALHYALEESSLSEDAWIVHLDEETQLTSSGIKGICSMIKEEEKSGLLRIGQGPILYHRKWKEHPFLTLADNIRTGDDFARFHFQHRLGITIFGLHGSYIVVRNDIEKSIGFDFGPQGSITEDAFWALVAMEKGIRCRWVDGYLEEQSTQSFLDFIKQRRRWFQGLAKVAFYAPVKFRWRFSLGVNTFLWSIAPFAFIYTIANIFFGTSLPEWLRFLANYSFASFALLYIVGLYANLDEYGIKNPIKRFFWSVLQVLLLPVFSFMESLGVLYAIFRPVSGFHVVKK